MTAWYFAYGSNLWMEQLVRRTGEVWPPDVRPQRARLPNYNFGFTVRDGAEYFANIAPGGPGVLGVVYLYSEAGLAKLDVFERSYTRESVQVELENGELLDAVAYFAEPAYVAPPGRPSDAYLKRITRGAREQGLPEEYIQGIERMAASPGE